MRGQNTQDIVKDTDHWEELRTEDTEKEAGGGEEQRTEDTAKEVGQEKKQRTEDATQDYGCDDEGDEVIFPLSGPGINWYKDKGVKAKANEARTEERMRNAVIMDDGEIKGLLRGSATGTLSENIDVLIDKLNFAASSKQQDHLSTMISIGYFIMNNGLIVPTQDLAERYKELKGLKESCRIESARLLEVLSKHLNVVQIYIEGRGYIIENHGQEIVKIVDSLKGIQRNDQSIVNQKLEEAIGSNYETVMQYLDSKRDRDMLKAVLAKVTSVNFTTKLANVQDKRSFQRSKGLVGRNLELFKEMKNEIMSNLESTSDAERKKNNRILERMKLEKLRHIHKGRGRKLKCEEFPDLAGILEFAFGEGDRSRQGGRWLRKPP